MNLRRYKWTISRRILAAFAAVLTALVCSVTGFGQCTLSGTVSTWSDSNSNWNNASHWSPAGVPNSSSTSVCITNGTSTVNLDINASVDNLQLASGNTLTTNLNTQLSVFGTQILNNGQLVINGGGGTNSLLLLDNSMTLSGTGTLTLSTTTAGGGSAFLEQGIAGMTLTNSSTIQGEGIIGNNGLTLINQAGGTINANSTGGALITTLTLQSGTFSNQGLMEATKSGVLQINNPTVNNAGGNITANAGMVQFFGGAVIQGGTLNTLNGGTLTTLSGNVATLDGSTHGALTLSTGSTYNSPLNTQTTVLGTITNKGNFQVNGGSGTNTFLLIGNNATLNGGGTVILSTSGGGGSAFIEQSAGGLTLTNADNTIQGAGIIGNNGLALSNSGTINANVSGQTLTLNGGGGFTNKNLMEATSSGVLQVTGITVNNAGGNITANGGTVQFFGSAVIQGGTLTNSSGTLGTPQGNVATLDGKTQAAMTIKGTYTSTLNTQTTVLGTINNTGNIQLNGGSGTNSFLLMGSGAAPSETLQGGGTVTLSTTAAGGGSAFLEQSVSGITLTNVNNTIQGEGIIGNNGLTLINQAAGTINANSTGGSLTTTLTLQSGAFTNQGLMEATKSGVLQFNNPTVNNAGGNITASGGTVQFFSSAVIQGGTLTNNGGTLGTPSGNVATLDGNSAPGAITIKGTYTSALNTQTTVLGTINNTGNIQLNGGSGTNSFLLMGSGVAPSEKLQGGGTVTLSTTAAGGGSAFIEQSVSGITLTNVNNTIQGEGVIGNNGLTLINQAAGTINANSTGGSLTTTLTLQSGAFTNQGLMEATKSGVLQFNNPTVNNAGGNITANGGTVQFFGSAVIQGGTLNSLNGGTLTTPTGNVATLDGSTKGALTLSVGSTYTSALNTQTTILGTITNKGNIQVNGGSGTNTFLFIGNNTTLNGTGTVTLSTVPAGGGSAFIEQSVAGLTLTNAGNTIQGAGIIGNNGLSLVNGGTLFANASGQTLLFNGSGALTNNGTLSAGAGSTLQVTATLTNFTNTANGTLTGGTYNATGTLQFGSLNTSIQTDNANIVLNGATAQLINLGGQNLLTPLSSIGAASSFILQGGANFTTAGNLTINSTGTLTVGSGSTFNVKGNLTNISGGTLSGGTYNLTGTLKANNASGIKTIAASTNITLTGSGAIQNQSGVNALTGLATIASGGSFTINGGAKFTTAGAFSDAGKVTVGSASTFSSMGNYTDTGTSTVQSGGVFSEKGTLSGAGAFTNSGTLEATAGNILDLKSSIANKGGTILATGAGGQVLLDGAAISGGTLSTASGGTMIGENSATLNGSSSALTISTGSTLQVSNGQTVDATGTITNNGTLSLNSTGSTTEILLTGNTTLGGGGALTLSNNAKNVISAIASTATLTNSGSIQGSGNIGNSVAGLVNSNSITANQSVALTIDTGSGGFSNPGTLTVNSGDTLDIIGGAFKNLSGTTLSGGTYSISGTMQYNSASDIATNSASVTLTGSGAKVIDSSSKNALTGLASNTSTGKFTVTGGQALSDSAAALTNAGSFTVGKSSSLTLTAAAGAYKQTGGTTTVDGTLTAPGGITISGGSVFGNGGTLGGNVTDGGVFNIGDALKQAGLETISKNYTQASAGSLNIDIGGTTAGTKFDQLDIASAAALNGALNLDLLNGFVPTLGATFDIMNFGSRTGTFSAVTGTGINGSEHFSVIYNATNVTLDVVSGATISNSLVSDNSPSRTPEPGALLLLGTGLVSLAAFARHRRPLERRLRAERRGIGA